MREELFIELESIDIELNRLSLKNLNKKEREYRKYLISKIERLSKEIISNGKKSEILKLQEILKKFLFNYEVREYYKYFDIAI